MIDTTRIEAGLNIKELFPDISLLYGNFVKEASIKINQKLVNVILKTRFLKTSKGEPIGTHITVTLIDLTWDIDKALSIIDKHKPIYQFYYNEYKNRYYQSYEPIDITNKTQYDHISLISREKKTADAQIVDAKVQLEEIPAFYRGILPIAEAIAKTTNDHTIANTIKGKRSSALNIVTYRLIDDLLIKLDRIDYTTEIMLDDCDPKRKNVKDDSSKNLLQIALKNKSQVEKALRSVPVSRGLILLILVCILATFLSIVLAIIQYIVYVNLFNTMQAKAKGFYMLPGHYILTASTGTFIMQAIAVNR